MTKSKSLLLLVTTILLNLIAACDQIEQNPLPSTSTVAPRLESAEQEAQTDSLGQYEFRTILPGLYEPRPRHIHVKVRLDGQEILTTQFYFTGEVELLGADSLMLIDAQPGVDEAGNAVLQGQRDIFLNVR